VVFLILTIESSDVKVEAAHSSQAFVTTYQTLWCQNNCLLIHVVEGKIEGRIEVTGR
jgi:hypothetical protein